MYILHITQLYNTSKSYHFSTAICYVLFRKFRSRLVSVKQFPGLSNKQEGFYFNLEVRRSKHFCRKSEQVLKHFQRCKQFSKSALSCLPNRFHVGESNKFSFLLASPQTSVGVRLRRNECETNEPQRTSAGRLPFCRMKTLRDSTTQRVAKLLIKVLFYFKPSRAVA